MQDGTQQRLGRVWQGILGLYRARPDTGSAGAKLVGLAFAAEDFLVQDKTAPALAALCGPRSCWRTSAPAQTRPRANRSTAAARGGYRTPKGAANEAGRGSQAAAFIGVVLGGAALVAPFFCVRREGAREGRAPIYVAGAVVGVAYALVLAEDGVLIELGLPLRPGTARWGAARERLPSPTGRSRIVGPGVRGVGGPRGRPLAGRPRRRRPRRLGTDTRLAERNGSCGGSDSLAKAAALAMRHEIAAARLAGGAARSLADDPRYGALREMERALWPREPEEIPPPVGVRLPPELRRALGPGTHGVRMGRLEAIFPAHRSTARSSRSRTPSASPAWRRYAQPGLPSGAEVQSLTWSCGRGRGAGSPLLRQARLAAAGGRILRSVRLKKGGAREPARAPAADRGGPFLLRRRRGRASTSRASATTKTAGCSTWPAPLARTASSPATPPDGGGDALPHRGPVTPTAPLPPVLVNPRGLTSSTAAHIHAAPQDADPGPRGEMPRRPA